MRFVLYGLKVPCETAAHMFQSRRRRSFLLIFPICCGQYPKAWKTRGTYFARNFRDGDIIIETRPSFESMDCWLKRRYSICAQTGAIFSVSARRRTLDTILEYSQSRRIPAAPPLWRE